MQKILSYLRKAIEDFHMIEEGDKIAVGLSGGKDSITLLSALKALNRFYPKHFDIIAISVDPGFEFFNRSLLEKVCEDLEVPLFIEESHIKEIVFDIRKEKNPCSLCANLRRGILNTTAIREGCNKIALGHNEDDVLETFLLNLFYTGSISTFAPVREIRRFIKKQNITVMPKTCPMDGVSKREDMKQMIKDLQIDIPHVRANLYGAITRSHIKGWGN